MLVYTEGRRILAEDQHEARVWVRVDPAIENLLGLEDDSLTKDPQSAPYPTRLALDGKIWEILVPAEILDGRIWVGPETAADRLLYPLKRGRSTVGRYIRDGRYPRRLAPDGVTWQVGLPAGTPLAPIDELRRADARIVQLEGELEGARSESARRQEREEEAQVMVAEVSARNHRLIARLEDEVFYRYYISLELLEFVSALGRSQERAAYLAGRGWRRKMGTVVWILVAVALSTVGTYLIMERLSQ